MDSKIDNAIFIIKSYHVAQLVQSGSKYYVKFKHNNWTKKFKETFTNREDAIQFIKSLGFTVYEIKYDRYYQKHYLNTQEKQWNIIYKEYEC
jgi:hypothetical protein